MHEPKTQDTLDLIRNLRARYERIAQDQKYYWQCARNDPNRLPEYVAKATIEMRELAERIEQSGVMPTPPVMVAAINRYTALVVEKVQRGL